MSDDGRDAPLSKAGVVFIVVVAIGFVFLLAVALLPKLIGPLMGDSFGMIDVSIVNNCDDEVRILTYGESGQTVSTAYELSIVPGEPASVYADPAQLLIAAPGGPWRRLTLDSRGDATVGGETCPDAFDPASEQAIALRAPLLVGANIEVARLDPGGLMHIANQNSELTTITATVDAARVAQWVAEYDLAPVTSLDPDLRDALEAAAPGAEWLSSIDFRQAMPSAPLSATAYVDAASGTVVVRLWEIDGAS